jgi:hypothetical protein
LSELHCEDTNITSITSQSHLLYWISASGCTSLQKLDVENCTETPFVTNYIEIQVTDDVNLSEIRLPKYLHNSYAINAMNYGTNVSNGEIWYPDGLTISSYPKDHYTLVKYPSSS